MKYGIYLAIGLFCLCIGPVHAQNTPELDQLEAKVSRHLESQMVGWAHKRGEPIQGSRNVLVAHWSWSNRVITISILPQKSAQAVREKMQSFVRITPEAPELNGFCDDAYSCIFEGLIVVLREGMLTLFVRRRAAMDMLDD